MSVYDADVLTLVLNDAWNFSNAVIAIFGYHFRIRADGTLLLVSTKLSHLAFRAVDQHGFAQYFPLLNVSYMLMILKNIYQRIEKYLY